MRGRGAYSLILSSVFLVVCTVISLSYAAHRDAVDLSPLSEAIKNLVEEPRIVLSVSFDEEEVYLPAVLKRFYENRSYKAAWAGPDKSFENAGALVSFIENSGQQGLFPGYYHLEVIKTLIIKIRKDGISDPEDTAVLDLLLSDAFIMLGCHISAGCVNPVTVEADWHSRRNDIDMAVFLEDALKSDNIRESLMILLPPHDKYQRLLESLENYRAIEDSGGWPPIPADRMLKLGEKGEAVRILRNRLQITGDLTYDDERADFDEGTERSVIGFQKRHGIKIDGIAGPETITALNIPVEERLKQIIVNLERMRWISRNLGHRYIMVNIADYILNVVENNESVMSMEVIVGKPYWNTPVFTDEISYIVFNPTWSIPRSIVRNEVIHKIKRSTTYLKEQGIRLFNGWSHDAEEIDSETINWDEATAGNFRYILRQDPGPLNPLGRIKFMLPNRFNIYLHDTSSLSLFSRTARAFSHGCIRIKRPVDLAEYLLHDDPEWRRINILDAMYDERELKVMLASPVRVHILYMTAWVDEKGILQFRKDIYGRDERLYEALKTKPSVQSL